MLLPAIRKHPVATCLLIGVAIRIVFFTPIDLNDERLHNDTRRFLYQADNLLAGEGFLWRDSPCTSLPPGYPVFLATVKWFCDSPLLVQIVQQILSVASGYLVYLAVRPRSEKLALFALFAMCASPWFAWRSWMIMSEVWGGFLAALFVFLLSKCETKGCSRKLMLATGACAIAMVLSSPFLVFPAFAVCVVLVWKNRKSPALVGTLTAGALLMMLPWQLHCYRALGRIAPMIYPSLGLKQDEGFQPWLRSWLVHPRDQLISKGATVWNGPREYFDRIPHYAFQSDQERERIRQLASQRKRDGTPQSELDKVFLEIAEERIRENPVGYYATLPAIRSITQWLDMQCVAHAQTDYVGRFSPQSFRTDSQQYGRTRAMKRLAKAGWSTLVFGVHIAYTLTLLFLALGAIVGKRSVGVAILLGVIAYTLYSAHIAVGEQRRNLPFYPLLFFLLFYTSDHYVNLVRVSAARLFRRKKTPSPQ